MKNKKRNQNEFDPYSVDKLARIPLVLKIFVIKYWGAGAAALMVFMGLAQVLPTIDGYNYNYDAYAIFWIIFGLVIDLLMNRLIRMMGNPQKPTQKYIFVNGSSAFTIFGNILYACVTFHAIVIPYMHFVNAIHGGNLDAASGALWSPFNPFTWALLFVICDTIFLTIKNTLIYLYRRIKYGKEDEVYEESL